MAKGRVRVLVVDDDPLARRGLAREFRLAGCDVTEAAGVDDAERLIETSPPEVAVVDLFLREGHPEGLAVLEYLRDRAPAIVPVVLTGNAETAPVVDAIRLGAVDVIEKGYGSARLVLERIEDEAREVEPLEAIERRHILRSLGLLRSQTVSAARLGLSRRTLYSRVHSRDRCQLIKKKKT